MIKLLDLLNENLGNKQAVLDYLDAKSKRNFANSREGRIIKKITDTVNTLDGEELKQYLKSGWENRSSSWSTRLLYLDLVKKLEGE